MEKDKVSEVLEIPNEAVQQRNVITNPGTFRVLEWRKSNKARYNEYMREYMRRRRVGKT